MMPRWTGSVCCARYGPTKEMRDTPLIMLRRGRAKRAALKGWTPGPFTISSNLISARELIARVEANLKMARLRVDAAKRVSYRTAQTARH